MLEKRSSLLSSAQNTIPLKGQPCTKFHESWSPSSQHNLLLNEVHSPRKRWITHNTWLKRVSIESWKEGRRSSRSQMWILRMLGGLFSLGKLRPNNTVWINNRLTMLLRMHTEGKGGLVDGVIAKKKELCSFVLFSEASYCGRENGKD